MFGKFNKVFDTMKLFLRFLYKGKKANRLTGLKPDVV